RDTAFRYARILKSLGHRVTVQNDYDGGVCDLMIALHARKSFDSIRLFRSRYPDSPLIVVLTGTDIYRDMEKRARVRQSLNLASKLVVLQRLGLEEIPDQMRSKARVIYQSASAPAGGLKPPSTYFRICVVGHLRREKDPFRAALAARILPAASRIRIVHVGSALNEQMKKQAIREIGSNRRYRWTGGLPHWKTRRLIASSHL